MACGARAFFLFFVCFFIIRLPPEFLPVSGPLTWGCASTLGAARCEALGQAYLGVTHYTYAWFMVFSHVYTNQLYSITQL